MDPDVLGAAQWIVRYQNAYAPERAVESLSEWVIAALLHAVSGACQELGAVLPPHVSVEVAGQSAMATAA